MKNFRLFIIIFILVLIFLPGFAKLQEMRQKLNDTENRIRQVQRRNAALEERIAQLQNNTQYLEMVAREKMGMVRKGETVLKIVREDEVPANMTTNSTAGEK